MDAIQEPTPCAQAASIRFCISRPSSMPLQVSSPRMTRAIPSFAPARCQANWPSFESAANVSRFFTTTRSQGCVFLADPVQRPISRMSRRTSSGISRSENCRTARSDLISFVSATRPVYEGRLARDRIEDLLRVTHSQPGRARVEHGHRVLVIEDAATGLDAEVRSDGGADQRHIVQR